MVEDGMRSVLISSLCVTKSFIFSKRSGEFDFDSVCNFIIGNFTN